MPCATPARSTPTRPKSAESGPLLQWNGGFVMTREKFDAAELNEAEEAELEVPR